MGGDQRRVRADKIPGDLAVNKFGNRKVVTADGVFDSQKEYERWCELKLMQKAKIIAGLRRQEPFYLIPVQRDPVTKKMIERECKYVADFVYAQDGKLVVEDVKSSATKTPEYKIKRKLMLYLKGIRIKEV